MLITNKPEISDEHPAFSLGGGASADDELLGSGDIQSLADHGNSYEVIREMRPVPFGLKGVLRLAATTAAPLVPLVLTIFSVEELAGHLIKVLF